MTGTAAGVVALCGALVAGTFATQLTQQWVAKRRPHALAWAASLGMYAVGMVVLAISLTAGWTAVGFAMYWITGALITVPLLGVGQASLLDPVRAPLYATLGGLAMVWAVSAVIMGTADSAALAEASARGGIPSGADVYGADTLAYGVLRPMTYGGLLVVVIGSLWSGLRSRRFGILLIALGTAIAGTSSVALRMEADGLVAVILTAGVSVMFLGFRAAGKAPRPSRAQRRAADATA